MRVFANLLLVMISAAFLSACVTPNPQAIGPFPTNYRDNVISYVKDAFFDPYSIRDAEISYPQQGHLFFQQGWLTCLRANAKNRLGGYTGRKVVALLINNGRVVQSMSDAPLCNQVSYQGFEELEKL